MGTKPSQYPILAPTSLHCCAGTTSALHICHPEHLLQRILTFQPQRMLILRLRFFTSFRMTACLSEWQSACHPELLLQRILLYSSIRIPNSSARPFQLGFIAAIIACPINNRTGGSQSRTLDINICRYRVRSQGI